MKGESRTENSIKNLTFSLGGQIINLLARFIVQTVFIYYLGKEYLGLSGLFSNILSLLSLAELGVGGAIAYSLYRPIAENDEEKIARIMALFKKAYIIIGFIVLFAGSALTPFLKFFVSNMPNIPYIRLIYILYVLNSSITYFYSYKATYVTACQKNYIVTNINYLFSILCYGIQCVILVLTREYLAYLIIQVVITFSSNIVLSVTANRKFPVLKKKPSGKLPKKEKKVIWENVTSVFIQKIGGTIVFSTDNILLSKIFGLAIVGVYSNYTLIINALESVINEFFTAIMAGVGNLGVTADKNHQYYIYKVIFFINFWIYSFVATGLGVLLTPFITMWVGTGYLMETICVFFIVINFFIKGMRRTNQVFIFTYGLVPHYKYIPIVEALINLVASIVLAHIFGPVGIFAGTTVSTVVTNFWLEPKILYNYAFTMKATDYVGIYIRYAIATVIIFLLTYGIASQILLSGLIGLIARLVIILIIPNLIVFILYGRSEEFKYFRKLLLRVVRRK